jgi:acyl carrier protein
MEYAKTFFQLIQQQNTLFMNNKSAETGETKKSIMDSFERSMMQFHHQQAETLRIHEQYLREQLEHTKNFFHLIQQEYSLIIDGAEELTPVIPLQLTDIRTENLREISPQNPQLTVPEMVVSSTSKTLEVEIPQPIIEPQSVITTFPETRVEKPPVSVTEIAISSQTKKSAIDIQDIGKSLLSITSEKTGYPIEMLEFDMDMEADLGIDSIKRVEILGGLQELYPDLPKPNLEELAEKRTIGQIVEYLEKQVVTNSTTNQINHSQHIVKNVDPKVIDIPHSSATSDEYSSIAETLLKITSEKTGYPVEMLELDMDMEADLGIDSIKRVEILGGMQEVYPDLPKPNLEELGDLRTIRQIVNYLQSLVVVEKKNLDFEQIKATVVELNPPPTVDPNLPRRPVKLKILPEPDFWECQLPEGHIGLITDDGSLTTTKLVHELIDKGWKLVVLSFPQSIVPERSPLPAGVTRINLANMSEEHLQLLLQSISVQYGKVGAFIHLHPCFSTTNLAYLETEKVIVKHIFLIAKHLKQSLNNAANLEGRVSFCTVVHLDGAFGLEHTENFGIIGGGLFGLTKSLRWEWPKVFLRAIDLSPKLEPHQSAEYIVAELYDSNRYIGEVGYGPKGRVTLVATAD